MKILSIETSCDETALSIVEADGSLTNPNFSVLGNALFSQIHLHAEFGGVVPNIAKREHSKRIVPLLAETLKQANLLRTNGVNKEKVEAALSLLEKEPDAKVLLEKFLNEYAAPDIDLIAVTVGPGLEPALWVGINVARALATAWQKEIIGVNHMEGHIVSVLGKTLKKTSEESIAFPAVALLVSGGHTELHLVQGWTDYKLLGATRDDAVGEAFDKVARILGLPYPGGPEISKLAAQYRAESNVTATIEFPRPMMNTDDYEFSFSGLKTAVLYTVRDLQDGLTEEIKKEIAKEFEDAAIEVLVKKTLKAVEEFGAQTIIVGGGVAANDYLRNELRHNTIERFGDIPVLFPEKNLSTDNSIMIALAGYLEYIKNGNKGDAPDGLRANGNLKI